MFSVSFVTTFKKLLESFEQHLRSIKTTSVKVAFTTVYDIKTDRFPQYSTVFKRFIGHTIADREWIRTFLVEQSYTIVFDP